MGKVTNNPDGTQTFYTDSATAYAGAMLEAMGDDAPKLTQAEFEALVESIREGDRRVEREAEEPFASE